MKLTRLPVITSPRNLSVSSTDRMAMKLALLECIADRECAFSILNGSNGNETSSGRSESVADRVFQYPQRIEWQ